MSAATAEAPHGATLPATGSWELATAPTPEDRAGDLRIVPRRLGTPISNNRIGRFAPAEQPGRHRKRDRGDRRSSRRKPRGVGPPRIRRRHPALARGCRVPAPTSRPPAVRRHWELTNRGIALILVSGAVLAAAALTAIVTTALTVTSPDYHPPQTSIVGH
jgi:hypothetical protein